MTRDSESAADDNKRIEEFVGFQEKWGKVSHTSLAITLAALYGAIRALVSWPTSLPDPAVLGRLFGFVGFVTATFWVIICFAVDHKRKQLGSLAESTDIPSYRKGRAGLFFRTALIGIVLIELIGIAY